MLRILKRFYPLREIARIIDLHFQRLDDLSRRLTELQNFRNVEGREIAENQTAILQALTFTVERLQQQHAAMEQLEGQHASHAEAFASLIERLQQHHAALERIEGGLAKGTEVSTSVVEQQQQAHTILERLDREIAENHLAILQALTFTVERQEQDRAALERVEGGLAKGAEVLASVADRQRDQGAALERVEGGLAKGAEVLASVADRQRDQGAALERVEGGLAKGAEALASVADCQEDQRAALERVEGGLAKGAEARQRMEQALASLDANLAALKEEALTSKNYEGLERALDRQTELVAQVHSQLADSKTLIENELVRQVYVESDDYDAVNPETGLLTFLYSHLPTRKALDVGAHVGDVSDRLLRAGYEVYAFEPAPAVYEKLKEKLEGRKDFTAFQLALGSTEGEALLHLATDLSEAKYYEDPTLLSSLVTHSMPHEIHFTHTVAVPVKTISELHRSGSVPEDISLVKIDTEGFDLEVIRGMEDHRYPVVAAEYFDVRMPFGESGLLYTLDTLIAEMRGRGYLWHIVMHRDWHCKHTAYYCNHELPVPGTWGNVIFFRDHDIFSLAQSWCSAVLPHTYFKPVRSGAVKDLKGLRPDRVPSA